MGNGKYTDEQLVAVADFITIARDEMHRQGYDTPVALEIVSSSYDKLTREPASPEGTAYAEAQDVEDFTTGYGTIRKAQHALAAAFDAGRASATPTVGEYAQTVTAAPEIQFASS